MRRPKLSGLGWVLSAAAADRLTKLAVQALPTDAADVLPGVIGLRRVNNTGIAFSLLSGGSAHQVLIIVLTIILLAALLYRVLFKRDGTLMRAALGLIAGGGLGNLYDRVFCGGVTDFIELQFIRFAVFNLADVFVCVGGGLLFLYIILEEKGKERGHG